jgi:signal transduction histidine kinase
MNAQACLDVSPPIQHVERRRILLVEDNPGDADLACERLAEAQSTEFDVLRAMTLREAIEQLATQSVDAIILDLGLPDSRGVDTVRRLKTVSRDTPIIVVSGYVDDHLRALALDEGAEEVFAKDETNSRLFWRSVLQIIEHRRAQNRQLQMLLDATPDAMLALDSSCAIRYFNRAAVELFARDRESLLGEQFDFALRIGQLSEIVVPRDDGGRVCEMRVVQLEQWYGDLTFLAVIRDITERTQAEQLRARSAELIMQNRQVIESSRLKSEFLASISHELRTPLNAIIGFSSILHGGLVDPTSPKHKAFLGHIVSGSHHLLQLINDLLDLAKIEAGKATFHPEFIDLSALVREVVAVLGAISAEKRIRVELDLDTSLTDIYLDPGRFKQVLYNYLSNALKFTPDDGHIVIHTRRENEVTFRLAVEDSGVGIAPTDIARLFSEFHQIKSEIAKSQQGTGLGLALTKRLVEAQGGSVGVHSVLGKGSSFFALLPRTTQPLKSLP